MLEIKNISKSYNKHESPIIHDINLEIKTGEIVGLIGSNGAGKTTLMKLIAKTKKPTEGQIYIDNIEIFSKDNVLNDVGIMIDMVFFPHLSARENVEFYLKVNNLESYNHNIDKVLKLVGLENTKNKKASNFSFGMKQRLSLAICLVSEPKLAIMDEPFVGLDPNGVNTLIKSLKEWAIKKGMTVLISSHQLNELEEICNRFTILKHGTLKEANLGQEKYLKISVKEKILEEDEKQLTLKFKTIQNISEASIYLNSESKEMSDIINYMLPKYSLDSTETIGDNLYDYFNEGDC